MNPGIARSNLSSRPPRAAAESLLFLGGNGTLADLPLIMGFIRSVEVPVKEAALGAATTLIREKLIEHFDELQPAVRKKLGSILDSLHPSVVDEISSDIFSKDPQRRIRAVQILGLLKKHPKIRNLLARLIRDKDQKIRATAANLLGKFTATNDLHIIISLLGDSDKRVRANTIEALESQANPRVIPFLLRYRKDPNNRIRGNTLKALYNLGQTDIFDSLTEMVESTDRLMIASGFWVISQIHTAPRPVVDLAGKHLLSTDSMVSNNARKALTALNTPRARGFLKYLLPAEKTV